MFITSLDAVVFAYKLYIYISIC